MKLTSINPKFLLILPLSGLDVCRVKKDHRLIRLIYQRCTAFDPIGVILFVFSA